MCGHYQQTTLHSREVTLALPHLEYRGFLVASGEFKQKIYTLPGVSLPTPATRDPHGRLISEHFSAPDIDDVARLTENMRQQLFQLASEPRRKKRLDRNTMEAALLRVCQGHFVSISAFASRGERRAIHPASVSEGASGSRQAQAGVPTIQNVLEAGLYRRC